MGNEPETCCKSKVLGKPFSPPQEQFFFLDPACTRLADYTVVRLCKSFVMTLFKQFSDFMIMNIKIGKYVFVPQLILGLPRVKVLIL